MVNSFSQSVADIHRDGFASLGQVFDPREIVAIHDAFLEVADRESDVQIIRENEGGEIRSMMGWERSHPVLQQFATDSRVISPVQAFLNAKSVVFHQTKYNPKAPSRAGKKWDPHRGISFWNHLDGIRNPHKIASVFIALTDQTPENGAVFTWKGAHDVSLDQIKEETDFSRRVSGDTHGDTADYLSLQIKPEKIQKYDAAHEKVQLAGPAGTVWILDSRNLHASPENTSDAVRELVANVFRTQSNYPMHPRKETYLCNPSNTPITPYRK